MSEEYRALKRPDQRSAGSESNAATSAKCTNAEAVAGGAVRHSGSIPDHSAHPPAAQPCSHKDAKGVLTIKGGYEGGYDLAWCAQCGVITWASDGIIPDWAVGKNERTAWCQQHVLAWGCNAESKGRDKCKVWCGQTYCAVTFNDPPAAQSEQGQDELRATLAYVADVMERHGWHQVARDSSEFLAWSAARIEATEAIGTGDFPAPWSEEKKARLLAALKPYAR